MKRSQIQTLIKEIATLAIAEMTQPQFQQQPQRRPEAYLAVEGWEFDSNSDTAVNFKQVMLPDNRVLDITVELDGNWDDGAFGYERGMQKGVHRQSLQFQPDKVNVTYAHLSETGQQVPLDAAIVAAGNALWENYEESIIAKMDPPSNEPDEPDFDR